MQFFVLLTVIICSIPTLKAKGFDLKKLPRGTHVTLPYPATTYVPLNERVTLSATDSPQSIKMISRSLNKRKTVIMELAIYDRNSERVKYLTVKPGVPYVYSFKGLSSIVVIPKIKNGKKHKKKLVLQVESDKSLTIAR